MFDTHLETLTLAQGEATPPAPDAGALPPPPGDGSAVTGAPAQPPGTGGPTGLFGNQFFFMLLLLFGAMILFSFMGQRRDRKKRQAMISAVKKHDRVQTVGGLIGSVVELKPETVILKVDEASNTRITFTRASIQQVLTVSPEDEAPSEEADE